MAFDGITIAALVYELNENLIDGRITKIQQPEKDELLLTIKKDNTYRLFISANASVPLIYLTDDTKTSPMSAPAFCMLLRKHFTSAKIKDIKQGDVPGSLERMVDMTIEHFDEMGDLKEKHLITEIMGKHSNIILCDEDYTILDSIKRVSGFLSSVREVLPGRKYFLPKTVDKKEALTLDEAGFNDAVILKPQPLSKAIYLGITGLSPQAAEEILCRAGIPGEMTGSELSEDLRIHLFKTYKRFMDDVENKAFHPFMIFKGNEAYEFSAFDYRIYDAENMVKKEFPSISEVLHSFYALKNENAVMHQKSSDLRRIVSNAVERESKKLELQLKQLSDTDKRDKYRVYGELITTYGYSVESGSKSMTVTDYYTNEPVTIPLDPLLSPIENAKKYFDKYSKLKRTYEALTGLTAETKEALEYLKSVQLSLNLAASEDDLTQVKNELVNAGFIKRHTDKSGKTKTKVKSTPMHYVSPEGVHFYVGRNNIQNDELTFGFADNNDWWFHAKGVPGSHVIMKCEGEAPDKAFEDAGALAAFYSAASKEEKVSIDYIRKKEVKKPANAKPGFVIYHTNFSLIAKTDISGLKRIDDEQGGKRA